MPFVLASLIFAVSLSLLPYTEPPEDLPPDSSPRTHLDRLSRAKEGNWRDWTHPLRVHAEDEDGPLDPVGDAEGRKRALVDVCARNSESVRLNPDEQTGPTGAMGKSIEMETEMPTTCLGLNVALPPSAHGLYTPPTTPQPTSAPAFKTQPPHPFDPPELGNITHPDYPGVSPPSPRRPDSGHRRSASLPTPLTSTERSHRAVFPSEAVS
ncbi:hypothetical protein EHS25_007511 [Saitozyma podzolica]|uniref:Uncharacterized protein n=1 Tax=Saitozyma podzolica TaxID=1890683 RepID=A0A427YPX9_9TREE|nr:hypothetical protein EHS25_007511 [Saitozyma podzolica]